MSLLESADWATLRYMAHKLKATIAMMGIAELQAIIMKLEKLASEESGLEEVNTLIEKIAYVYKGVYTELQAKLESLQQEV